MQGNFNPDSRNPQSNSPNFSPNSQNPSQFSGNNRSQISWMVIIIAMIVFFPVGIFLLARRIGTGTTGTPLNGRVITVFGTVITIIGGLLLLQTITFGIVFHGRINGDSVRQLLPASLFLVAGISLLRQGKKNTIKDLLYAKYVGLINRGNFDILALSRAIPTSYEETVADLQSMINRGLLPNAYIDHGKRRIVTFAPYAASPQNAPRQPTAPRSTASSQPIDSRFRQRVVITCQGCGSRALVDEGTVIKCDYCGNYLQ